MKKKILPGWVGALLLWMPPLAFLILFYFYPLGSILSTSLAAGNGSLVTPFAELFTSSSTRSVIIFTFYQAILSTLFTLLLGLPVAYLMSHYRFKGKAMIQALTGVPFVLPAIVVAAAFNALMGPRGWINLGLMSILGITEPPIQFTNTLMAILVAHVFYNTTIIVRTVGDFWSHMDPRVGQAAQVLGANRWQVLREVTLPLLVPSIATASLLVFLFDFTSFAVVMILGGPRFATMEVEIYYQTVSLFNLPAAAALSILQLIFTLIFTATYARLSERTSRPVSLKPQSYTQKPLRGTRSRILAGVLITILLLLMVSPLLALSAQSFTQFERMPGQPGRQYRGLTLDYYRELNINRRETLFYASPLSSIGISLSYASITVVLALTLGLPAAFALARDTQSRLNHLMDPMLMLPLGTSAVTLGLGFIVALDQPPLDLRTSPFLVPLAHTLVAFPFVVRSLAPALRSIRPRLRQAASVMGASPIQVVRLVDLPMAGKALLVAAVFAFTISLGEFGATALIARPEYPTIPVAIFRLISQPGALFYGQAMALSTILMAVTAAGILAIERFRPAGVGEF